MVEPFKNNFNVDVIRAMAKHLARADRNGDKQGFDDQGFITFASHGLDDLELKQRADRITEALERHLPRDFPAAAHILIESLAPAHDQPNMVVQDGPNEHGIKGWAVMAMAEFIARNGQDPVHLALSLDTLKVMTSRFSSEFAIRPFLANHTEQTLKTVSKWTTNPNEHVRRLVSEGTRPRLPWGMRLKTFVADPSPVVALLEDLKDDPSEYVRRSVANNLNDIAKDHPDLVASIAQGWMTDANVDRKRLIKHGLRTLIKAGNANALQALGYGPAKVEVRRFSTSTPRIVLGEALVLQLDLTSTSPTSQPLVIDYAVHHIRANGQTTAKVFKWKTLKLDAGAELRAAKRHAIKPITTRRYYPGRHRVELLINGKSVASADFELVMSAP